MRDEDPLAAARGIVNGTAFGVILWLAVGAFLFYGFKVAL